ncbi:rubrerythrin-like domain-containing protein [Halalkalicoccus salilacus]|uniref:rubrerythrin-like domain-containing protein n=1 Tax=Halalkalicoccus salilacus TaxID=3117459 RepID=UPI00300E9CC5
MANLSIGASRTSPSGKYCEPMTANGTSPTWDVASDSETESTYECLDCGTRVTETSHPGSCPNCDASFRNCATSIE